MFPSVPLAILANVIALSVTEGVIIFVSAIFKSLD
jgi:hypothetical protein